MLFGLLIALGRGGALPLDASVPGAPQPVHRRAGRRLHRLHLAQAGALHRRRRHCGRIGLDPAEADRASGQRRGLNACLRIRRRRAATASARTPIFRRRSIGAIALVCLAVIGWLLYRFLAPTPLAGSTTALIVTAIPFIFIGGFLIAAICGYMAGLIGASNSPISGVGILAILFCSIVFVAVVHPAGDAQKALVAFALFATAIVFAIATISNNNLQDLKTGQLVGATPQRAAMGADHRRDRGRGRDSAGAQPAREHDGLPRRAESACCRGNQTAGGAAGDADLRAGARRDRRRSELEHDLRRHGARRGADRDRRSAGVGESCCACRRSRSASASICR